MNMFLFTWVVPLRLLCVLGEQWLTGEELKKPTVKRRSVSDLYSHFGLLFLMSQYGESRFNGLMCRECTWPCKYHLSESTTRKHKASCGPRARTDLSHHHSLLYYYPLKQGENQGQLIGIQISYQFRCHLRPNIYLYNRCILLKHVGAPQAKKQTNKEKVSTSSYWCSQNHRTAQVGRDLERSTGPVFHGKESSSEII